MIAGIWILVLLCVFATGRLRANESLPFDKLMELQGKEFVTAAEESSNYSNDFRHPYTVDQLIAVAERLLGTIEPLGTGSDNHELSPFTAYFEEACKNANSRQLDKLIEVYRRLDPNTFEKSYTLPTLASRVLARQVEEMPEQHLQIPMVDGLEVPPELKSAPEALQKPWRTWRSARAGFEKAFPKTTEEIEVSANMKSFYNLIGEALGGATGLEDDVRRFAWTGADCLGESEDIEDKQDMALLLMLLREGRTNEAIGAALRVAAANGSEAQPKAFAKVVINLFERCGLDWEETFAGGQVEAEARGWRSGDSSPYLAALAKYGSPRAAPLIQQLAYFAKPESRGRYVAIFNAWIQTTSPKANCRDTEVRLDLGWRASDDDRTAKAMPQSVQSAALRATEEFATADSSEDLALNAINIFRRTESYSSIPALKALTHHGSRRVVEYAALILCTMGEHVKIPAVRGPVRFKILANGKPLPQGMEIALRIEKAWFGYLTVQADGVVELPGAQFTIPDRPVTELEFKMLGVGEGGVIFETKVSPPWNFDEIRKVDLKVSSLEITLRNQEGLNAPPSDKAFVGVKRVSEEKENITPELAELQHRFFSSWRGSSLFRDENVIGAVPSIRLPAIEEGKYEVWIGVPGAEIWHQAITVGPKETKVEAMLKPGSDLRFQIVTPGGQRGPWAPLFKDGKEFEAQSDPRANTYRALPYGKYVLRIFGSDGFDEVRGGKKLKQGPDEVPFKSRDVPITVEKGSPAVIDLGEIRLEARPR